MRVSVQTVHGENISGDLMVLENVHAEMDLDPKEWVALKQEREVDRWVGVPEETRQVVVVHVRRADIRTWTVYEIDLLPEQPIA